MNDHTMHKLFGIVISYKFVRIYKKLYDRAEFSVRTPDGVTVTVDVTLDIVRVFEYLVKIFLVHRNFRKLLTRQNLWQKYQ